MKKLLSLLIVSVMALTMTACSKEENKLTSSTDGTQQSQTQQETKPAVDEEKLYADAIPFTIELENGGVMKGELYPNLAPKTVANFVKLAKDNFYDGLIFHRVIKDFMIQGGGYDENMTPKEAETVIGEFDSNGFQNPLKHTKGVISMARTPDPNSASSQFFIMHVDYPSLDGQYAAFGKVTEGLEFVDEIAETKTTVYAEYGMTDVPEKPIIIKTISVKD